MPALLRVVIPVAAALALAPTVAACLAGDHGTAEIGDCDGQVIELAGVGYYVITGDTPNEGWAYLESNGEPGLQRGGCGNPWLGGGSDPCQQSDNPDLLIY